MQDDFLNENKFFQQALGSFTRDSAYGGAIRHLTDLGLSAEEILDRLDYPVSIETVRKLRRLRLVETGKLSPETPEEQALLATSDTEYIKETDNFGRISFRRVHRESKES